MKYYFAPMEGITGYIHRNVHHHIFPHMDKYFTAFISTNQNGKISSKERADILPENNKGIYTVPQILTNSSHDFLMTAKIIQDMGYKEINLNLGCPSKTVVSKRRGSGFLGEPERLDRFLDEIYKGADMEISVKTRLGIGEPEEFYRLLEIYNQYPLKELIIHPRTQQDFYKNKPDWTMFQEALRISKHDICYNGDLFSAQACERFTEVFPDMQMIMIGRGLLINPGLVTSVKGGQGVSIRELIQFHDQIYEGYKEVLFGEKPVLFKMKELWSYMIRLFADAEKQWKKIRKAEHFDRYENAVSALFSEWEITKDEIKFK